MGPGRLLAGGACVAYIGLTLAQGSPNPADWSRHPAAAAHGKRPAAARTVPAPRGLVAQAQTADRRWGIPASVIIAQAELETGHLSSRRMAAIHSLYGAKCGGLTGGRTDYGPIAVGCKTLATSEQESGAAYRTTAKFRVYRTDWDAIRDYAYILTHHPAYRPALAHRSNPEVFARAVARGGWATSPGYGAALVRIIHAERLTRYDR